VEGPPARLACGGRARAVVPRSSLSPPCPPSPLPAPAPGPQNKEKEELSARAKGDVVLGLLPLVDAFELARTQVREGWGGGGAGAARAAIAPAAAGRGRLQRGARAAPTPQH
jgi:hypothetical protein